MNPDLTQLLIDFPPLGTILAEFKTPEGSFPTLKLFHIFSSQQSGVIRISF